MEWHLKIIGMLLMCLALSHVCFAKYFNWKVELSRVSQVNRQMMYVHAFFIAFGVFLAGLLCFTSATELVTTTFGKNISLGMGIFRLTRLFVQFFGYSSKLWKGKPFETTVHIVFSAFFIYASAVFIITAFL